MKKDDIEDIYHELEEYSKVPPKELWDNIEARLHPKKKKRRIIFFWGSAAAVLVMFFGYVFTNSLELNGNPINEISDIEESKAYDSTSKIDEKTTRIVDVEDMSSAREDSLVERPSITKEPLNNSTSQKQLTDRNKILNTIKNQSQLANRDEIKEQKDEGKNDFYEEIINKKKQSQFDNNSYAQSILNESIIKEESDKVNAKDHSDLQRKNKSLINNKEEKLIATNDSITNAKDIPLLELTKEFLAENEAVIDSLLINKVESLKWSVEVLGGIANTASEASIQGTSVNTTSQNNFVYTLKVGYSISDRLVVKSGVGKNILGQEINNIKYTGRDATLLSNNFESIVNNQDIMFLVPEASVGDFTASPEVTNEGTLQQQFDYVQVPLEVSYNVLKAQKFDVSLGVGGNINFLTNNRTFLDDEQIGESLGVNTTIYGATMNSNISYNLGKKTILFLEPSYNYFEKPIDNNNQTFDNTQLRVLFGLRYKF